MSKMVHCPRCNEAGDRIAPAKPLWWHCFLRLLLRRPYRCRACQKRFSAPFWVKPYTPRVAVKEVLSNPELLRAALGQHTSPPTQAQPTAATRQRPSIREVIKRGWSWACKKVTQAATHVKKKLGQGLAWCVDKLRQGCAALRHGPSRLAACSVSIMATLGAVSVTLWRLRRSCSIALSVGLIAGVVGYFAGPIISSMLCGLSGMALTLSSMILLPLWRLLNWNISATSN